MLERWEFIQFPCTKDPNRYKLKVKSTEEDLYKIIKAVSANTGRPFASLSHDYNWGVYFYGVEVDERNRVVDALKQLCSQGNLSQSKLEIGQELSPIFEEFLDATAKEFVDEKAKPVHARDTENSKDNKPDDTADQQSQINNFYGEFLGKMEAPPPKAEQEAPAIMPGIDRNIFSSGAEPGANLEDKPLYEQVEGLPPAAPEQAVEKPGAAVNLHPEVEKPVIFGSHLEESLEPKPEISSSGQPLEIETPIPETSKPADAAALHSDDIPLVGLNPRYTMSEFIVGPNNRFIHAAAKAVAENPGKIYNPLFIYGGVGLGKTHLMHAVGHYIMSKNESAKIVYVSTERFMSEVVEAIGKGTVQEFREKYRKVDILLIDDIQFLSESESTQEEFFHTFNTMHENAKQIIITSDRPPKQLVTLEDRLRSRFEWGLIADIKSPSLETRIAILKKKSENGEVNLDDNMLLYIAGKLKSNIRELEGFLKRINAYAALTGQEVNMELVKSIMRELLPEEELDDAINPTVEKPPEQVKNIAVQSAPVQKPVVEHDKLVEIKPPAPPAQAPKPPKMPQPSALGDISNMSKSAKDDAPGNLTPIEVAFFYPEGKEAEFNIMKDKFGMVIKKHKLKFRFESVFEKTYDYNNKINYAFFTELCKTNSVRIAVVLGAPSTPASGSEDFAGLLGAMMDDEKISMQYVSWQELNKDYKYLNLALDITLLKNKKN